jgi:hypothetical protein
MIGAFVSLLNLMTDMNLDKPLSFEVLHSVVYTTSSLPAAVLDDITALRGTSHTTETVTVKSTDISTLGAEPISLEAM